MQRYSILSVIVAMALEEVGERFTSVTIAMVKGWSMSSSQTQPRNKESSKELIRSMIQSIMLCIWHVRLTGRQRKQFSGTFSDESV